ncbi:hypothetical protein FRC03_001555 [Tulasnella sp. 419]|nr:hypothetical protein FRC02_006973 [Tulasnella sp. 418]KAG8969683.1 hypothetical protein FRC03_001555 [Tulasnella sp. 419]
MAPIHKFLSQVLGSVILAVILLQASVNAEKCGMRCPPPVADNWSAHSVHPVPSWAMAGLGSVCEYAQKEKIHNCRYWFFSHELASGDDKCPKKLLRICEPTEAN